MENKTLKQYIGTKMVKAELVLICWRFFQTKK